MKKVLVFAERMLPSTQTFLPLQVNELREYQAQYIGLIPAERNHGLPHLPILLTHDRSPLSRVRRELYRWTGIAPRVHAQARAAQPTLLHAHFAEGASAAIALSRQLRLPLILHLRGGAELFSDRDLRRQLFEWPYLASRRKLWARASLFLCVSDYIRRKALAAGFPAEKLRVHYTGMDLAKFSLSDPAPQRDRHLILFVGRLIPYKGCAYLLEAMQQVQQIVPAAHLVIIGDGSSRATLEQQARQLGIRAQFLGEQPQAHIRHWLERARLFCGPSVTLADGMSEAFGNVFSEAQGMGVPVVSFRHGGIPETMQEGVTGLLAPERDTATLARHLVRFLTDEAFWVHASEQSVAFVRQHFDVRRQTARLERLYDAAVESFRPGQFTQTVPALLDAAPASVPDATPPLDEHTTLSSASM